MSSSASNNGTFGLGNGDCCSGHKQRSLLRPWEEQFPHQNLFLAFSEGLWENGAACGRRYRLRCLSETKRPCKHRTIDVKVVDFCLVSPCPSTILLSRDAFAAIAHRQ
ncbi:hypothetical protein V6N11_022360 [Hibiscus sabdariffa]|uniref:Expansin-like EG45 domain-containing protein n=1 Tax=Hibiscus sabdariffa TaxID=183260 RepID=A0ABR2TJP1_9ROSI